MQIGAQAAAIMHHMDGYAEADCHFDSEVLRAAVKELIVCVIIVFAEMQKPPQELFFFRLNLHGSSRKLPVDAAGKKAQVLFEGCPFIFQWGH